MGTEKGHMHINTERDSGQRHKGNLSGQKGETEQNTRTETCKQEEEIGDKDVTETHEERGGLKQGGKNILNR